MLFKKVSPSPLKFLSEALLYRYLEIARKKNKISFRLRNVFIFGIFKSIYVILVLLTISCSKSCLTFKFNGNRGWEMLNQEFKIQHIYIDSWMFIVTIRWCTYSLFNEDSEIKFRFKVFRSIYLLLFIFHLQEWLEVSSKFMMFKY